MIPTDALSLSAGLNETSLQSSKALIVGYPLLLLQRALHLCTY
jgi:hypothetical protein